MRLSWIFYQDSNSHTDDSWSRSGRCHGLNYNRGNKCSILVLLFRVPIMDHYLKLYGQKIFGDLLYAQKTSQSTTFFLERVTLCNLSRLRFNTPFCSVRNIPLSIISTAHANVVVIAAPSTYSNLFSASSHGSSEVNFHQIQCIGSSWSRENNVFTFIVNHCILSLNGLSAFDHNHMKVAQDVGHQ